MTLQESKVFAKWLGKFFLNAVVFFLATTMLLRFASNVDDSDLSRIDRSGMRPLTDHRTGCQYLTTPAGALTPRLDGQGKQVGCWQGSER